MGYYKGNKVVVERQRDHLKAPLDDMNEETDTAQDFFDDSDSTELVISGGRLVKSIYVPTFAAETIHGPQDSILRAIEIITGCLYVDMVIESGAETQILTI